MRRTPLTQILAAVIALVATGIGLWLVTEGGTQLLQAITRLDLSFAAAGGGLALQLAGALLIVIAALTGIWSSAGLLVVAAMGLGSLVLSAMPMVTLELFRSIGALPLHWYDGVLLGLPQFVCLTLGTIGLAVMLQRRAPARHRTRASNGTTAAGHIFGLVGSPLLILGGIPLAVRGLDSIRMNAMRMEPAVDPVAIVLIFAGALLFSTGVLLVRWSPYALLLPALLLLAGAVIMFMPVTLPLRPPVMMMPFLAITGAVVAATLIAGTVALLVVRTRTRKAPRHAPSRG